MSKLVIHKFAQNANLKQSLKMGLLKNRKQQYHCKNCVTRFIDYYTNKACLLTTNNNIIKPPERILALDGEFKLQICCYLG